MYLLYATVLIFIVLFIWGYIRNTEIDNVKKAMNSDLVKEEREEQEIFALNNASVNSISGGFFLGGFNSEYGTKYKYLINTENGFQIKTISDTGDIFIKEVEGNIGKKIRVSKSVMYLKTSSLKRAYEMLGSDDFESLARKYDKTIFEVPKGTVKVFFDIDISK